MRNPKTGAIEPAQSESDTSRFEAIFLEHWAPVYRVILRLVGDPVEAEDLALEAFLRLYQRAPRHTETLNLAGWLYRVATNLGLHSIRGWQRRERYEMDAGRFALEHSRAEQPAELFEQAEERRLVRLTLARMNQRQAQLLVMRHSGLPYRELAAALGVAPSSIGPLLLRAEREFEKHYRALAEEEV